MSDIDRIPRSEDGENAVIFEVSGVREFMVDLESQTDSIGTQVYHIAGPVVHLHIAERRAGATGIGDGESVIVEGAQGSTRVAEGFEDVVASVDDGGSAVEVSQIDIDVGGGGFDGKAGSSGDGDDMSSEGSKGSTEGRREHHDSGGGR